MKPSYLFEIDVPRSYVRMTLNGFFSPEQVAEFDVARHAAYRELRCARNQHVTLVDMRGMDIQPQEAVAMFGQSLADPRTRSRRLAFVVAKSLSRLQIQRAAAGRAPAYFTTIEDAEAFLFCADIQAA